MLRRLWGGEGVGEEVLLRQVCQDPESGSSGICHSSQ